MYVELPAPSAVRVAGTLSPNLNPRGFEDYAADELTSDDNEDLFISDSDLSDSGLTERWPLRCGWTLGWVMDRSHYPTYYISATIGPNDTSIPPKIVLVRRFLFPSVRRVKINIAPFENKR